MPYPTTSIKAKGDLEADRSTLMVFDQGTALGGLSYQVDSIVNAPSAEALDIAPPPPAVIKNNYLEVPASYDSLRALAESIAGKAKTPLDKAVALQDWLANGSFKYTLKAPTVLNASQLSQFLNVTKSGYCQQFSFAMAVLARLLGIPSRVAYGFTSGSSLGDDEWQVTTHDAHAWPELYFSGSGWLRFEPTPSGATGQGTAYQPTYTDLASGTSPGTPAQSAPTTAPNSSAGSKANQATLRHHLSEQLGDVADPGLSAGEGAATAARGHGTNPWEVFGLVVAGLLILGLVAPWAARLVIRRRRWHLSRRLDGPDRADAEWAHAAWEELRDDLTDYGAGCLPSDTPRAVAARAGTELALAEPALSALGRIALAEERARYAARPTDGSGLRHDSVTVRRAIAVAVPRPIRWRGRLLPGLGDRPGSERNGPGSRHFRPPDPGVAQQVPDSGLLEAAFLSPAPALVEPFHHRTAGRVAAAAAPRTTRAALAGRAVGRPAAKRDGGHLPPAVQRPDAAEQQDNETAGRQADQRQDDPYGNHRRAEGQPNERLYHPTPVMHVGIAGAN